MFPTEGKEQWESQYLAECVFGKPRVIISGHSDRE